MVAEGQKPRLPVGSSVMMGSLGVGRSMLGWQVERVVRIPEVDPAGTCDHAAFRTVRAISFVIGAVAEGDELQRHQPVLVAVDPRRRDAKQIGRAPETGGLCPSLTPSRN